ncbi:hypothetical protein [Clostridium sp. DL1XJH146]
MYSDEDRAIGMIKGYLNVNGNRKWTKDYILTNYGLAVEMLVEKANKINSIKAAGVKSFSEGNQSVSFSEGEAWTITDDIKVLLPVPFVGMW